MINIQHNPENWWCEAHSSGSSCAFYYYCTCWFVVTDILTDLPRAGSLVSPKLYDCFFLEKSDPFTFLLRLFFYLTWTLFTDPLCQPVKFYSSKVKSMRIPQVSELWSRTLFFPSPFYWSQESNIWKRRGRKAKCGTVPVSLQPINLGTLLWEAYAQFILYSFPT